jgi:hypothetical protein
MGTIMLVVHLVFIFIRHPLVVVVYNILNNRILVIYLLEIILFL